MSKHYIKNIKDSIVRLYHDCYDENISDLANFGLDREMLMGDPLSLNLRDMPVAFLTMGNASNAGGSIGKGGNYDIIPTFFVAVYWDEAYEMNDSTDMEIASSIIYEYFLSNASRIKIRPKERPTYSGRAPLVSNLSTEMITKLLDGRKTLISGFIFGIEVPVQRKRA